jgi:hypothetical protein
MPTITKLGKNDLTMNSQTNIGKTPIYENNIGLKTGQEKKQKINNRTCFFSEVKT